MIDRTRRHLFHRTTPQEQPPALPWIQDLTAFFEHCVRCSQCIDACETQIIVHGDGGFPQVDFHTGECTFCYQCAAACPEKLFLPETASPWNAKATVSAKCLAQQNVECRSCHDSCEPAAIQFRLQPGKVAQPQINPELCNGCGACVAGCPTQAITVCHQTQDVIQDAM
ncbi:ferredoxin-type protein NapF [Vibrio mangrovi]|uniref:ferredoxin-type protein NapF n=1 Tax=Vibrio mangrovi TaxID=474394 RepID=UPI000B3BCD9D